MKVCKILIWLFLAVLQARLSAEDNKVIVKSFNWRIYSTEHFDIHYYDESRAFLDYAAQTLEQAYLEESAALNPSMDKRLPFFLFASQNDMEQNNIADVGDGVGGLTEPYKDRFLVWSDGSRGWLRDVIRHEFAHEVEFSVLIDGFWKSARILKTFIYPLWMMEGIAEFQTGDEDLALEKMYLRDAALSPAGIIPLSKLNQFAHLKPHQITLAYKTGASAIRFLSAQYGADKPGLMLDYFQNKYEASQVLKPLIGVDEEVFDKKFREYTEIKYRVQQADEHLQEPEVYGRRLTAGGKDTIPEFNISPVPSPDGQKIAWLSTRDGHPPVLVIKDLVSGRTRKLSALSLGAENIPYGRFSKPLKSLDWSGDGKYLVFSAQKNHREYLHLYDPESDKTIRLAFPDFMEVRQPVFSPDSRKILFVGMRDGLNDIYEITLSTSLQTSGVAGLAELKRLTEDSADESSPVYLKDGSGAFYSCEISSAGKNVRGLCLSHFGGQKKIIAQHSGNIYDVALSTDGSRLLFNSDADFQYELYELNLRTLQIFRRTRTVGGNFNPSFSPDGKSIIFSSFRFGSMNLYYGSAENFLKEASGQTTEPIEHEPATTPMETAGIYKPYKFKASTDLFFPAFMFSIPGGLFWMNYWTASDMLGNHNLGLVLNFNSGSRYFDYQVNYSYARYRMPVLVQASGRSADGYHTQSGWEYDKDYGKYALGTAYPFDRYNRLESFFVSKNETDHYKNPAFTDKYNSNSVQMSYIRDTVNGLYLVAVRGSRTDLSYLKADEVFGGNQNYEVLLAQRLQYVPLSKRSALVDKILLGHSSGPQAKYFNFGGLGGLRGFASSSDRYTATTVLLNNFEARVPLVRDIDYYMGFMFPDFYFKAIYGKLFIDTAYGRNTGDGALSLRNVDNSVGAGVNIHTFLLQAFQFILSFDYAIRTTDGGHIFYFYLGPMF